MRDYSKDKYRVLCKTLLDNGYKFVTLAEYLKCQNEQDEISKKVIVRHDLCRDAHIGIFGLLEVEQELGIKTSYYFRNSESYDLEVIAKVVNQGHEVGVHFDSLDKARGDMEKAKEILLNDIAILSDLTKVETIAMHGNPSSMWDNRDIFKTYSFQDFDLLGEAYLSVDFNKIWYYTDTGRNWTERKNNVKDIVPLGYEMKGDQPDIETTDDLIAMIPKCKKNIYLLVHPNRWRDSLRGWYWKLLQDRTKNIAKAIFAFIRKNTH